MIPALVDGPVTVFRAHALDALREMAGESVHVCVTSPPYWGLREYGTEPIVWGGEPACKHRWAASPTIHHGGPQGDRGTLDGSERVVDVQAAVKEQPTGRFCQRCGAWLGSLGLEPTPELYVEHIVEVFREVRRVLRPDGTLWLNIGDCYATGAGRVGAHPGGGEQGARWRGCRAAHEDSPTPGHGAMGPIVQPNRLPLPALKPKDLIGVPWMVAFALRADGWYLRSDIVWAKTAPMPESVVDRPTSAHEHVFLLSKSARYFYDAEAVRENDRGNPSGNGFAGRQEHRLSGGLAVGGTVERWELGTGRNMRNVWVLRPEPYPDAHFACFVTEVPLRAIKAGTSERGCCPTCGAPLRRVLESQRLRDGTEVVGGAFARRDEPYRIGAAGDGHWRYSTRRTEVGWEPSCSCGGEDTVPASVLDPFVGSGTTLSVARRLGRRSVGIELQPRYVELIRKRVSVAALPLLEQIDAQTSPVEAGRW